MIGLCFLRVLFVLIFTGIGYSLGGENPLFSAGLGFIGGIILVASETLTRRASLKGLSSAVFGIILGLVIAGVFGVTLDQFPFPKEVSVGIIHNIKMFVTFVFVYLGLTLGIKGKDEFNLVIPYVKFKRQSQREEAIIVDTSSIIDGRILDIVKTGFLEAKFVIPRFVLDELQALADSTDHMKRQKGKRGVEILHSLKKESNIEVHISEQSVKSVQSVDAKIIKLAQTMDAEVLTTDYNLNRIAQLQGVKILNINDLANALKPTFIAGQRFSLKLIKEGKEHKQAVGYLEDGTMVVVENSRRLVGKTVGVEVTSILQSSSGRIVFTKLAG